MNTLSLTLEPVLMFVTVTSPLMSSHPLASAGAGRTTISVAETLWTNAVTPARPTATGAWKPRPKIVTGEKGPLIGCSLLLTAVMIIGSV